MLEDGKLNVCLRSMIQYKQCHGNIDNENSTNPLIEHKELCEKLPLIIQDVVTESNLEAESNSVFRELENNDPNLLKSIYLFAFKKYEGFDDFNI